MNNNTIVSCMQIGCLTFMVCYVTKQVLDYTRNKEVMLTYKSPATHVELLTSKN